MATDAMTKTIATRGVKETLLGLVAHAESAPQTVRARDERRKRILERGGKLPQARRI